MRCPQTSACLTASGQPAQKWGSEVLAGYIAGEGLGRGAPRGAGHRAARGRARAGRRAGIQDTSRQGRHHNARYRSPTEELGPTWVRCECRWP